MRKELYEFKYEVFESSSDLPESERSLLEEARKVTEIAYAPYSEFRVGAVALLNNGGKVSGTNQENASYPVGLCAERALLATASALYTNIPIQAMAIAYHNLNGESASPVSPCGMCRQYISEYEERMKQPIRLILSGMQGRVIVIESAGQLLPLSFGSADLNG